jgi:hypothetical protein
LESILQRLEILNLSSFSAERKTCVILTIISNPSVNTASSSSQNELQSLHFFRNPTPDIDPLLGVTWTPVTKTELNYLNIDKELTMQKDLAKDRVAFWEELESSLR